LTGYKLAISLMFSQCPQQLW